MPGGSWLIAYIPFADISSCTLAVSKKKSSFVLNSSFATLNSWCDSAKTTLATIAVMDAERECFIRYRHQLSRTSDVAVFATISNHFSKAMSIDSSRSGATWAPGYIFQILWQMY